MAANHAHIHPPPPQQNEGYVKIASLVPQMNSINTFGIVLENHPARRLANGNLVLSMRIADPSGSIIFTIMNAEAQDLFEPGDILKIKNGFTNVHRGMLNLSCGRQGEFMKSGDFMMAYSELPNMSEFNSEYAAMERARKPSPPPEGEVRHFLYYRLCYASKRVVKSYQATYNGLFYLGCGCKGLRDRPYDLV
ncbi:unnamed protein product [Haemonchus placei]|uniref:Rep-A_N domain-containing protein n=1 Tax=Haemonchus placei TaxID=6290 RepID=A0A0N4WVG6_HAEPC|nr:unnamed protein product [Haemonchus placei]